MRPIHYAAIFTWIVAAALWVGKLEERKQIMFDPRTDGPILAEPARRIAAAPPGTCMTSISTDGGRSGVPVFTTCSIGTTTTSSTLITPISGGTYVAR